MSDFFIKYLADFPEYTPLLAKWRFQQWGHYNLELTQTYAIESMRHHLNHFQLPLSLIAFHPSHRIAGMVSLRQHDLKGHEDKTPWLASLFVTPEYQKQGLGELLVKSAESKAKDLGYNELYLYSFNPLLEKWYKKLGYHKTQEDIIYNHNIYVMRKNL